MRRVVEVTRSQGEEFRKGLPDAISVDHLGASYQAISATAKRLSGPSILLNEKISASDTGGQEVGHCATTLGHTLVLPFPTYIPDGRGRD